MNGITGREVCYNTTAFRVRKIRVTMAIGRTALRRVGGPGCAPRRGNPVNTFGPSSGDIKVTKFSQSPPKQQQITNVFADIQAALGSALRKVAQRGRPDRG